MARVTLGGKDYILKAGTKVRWSYVQPFQDLIRQREGILTRQDNQVVTRLRYGWRNGIGWARQDRETGRGEFGLRDSTWNTLHRIASYGILHESQTHAAPADMLKKFVNFKGDLWGLFEEDYNSGAITDVVARKFGATSDDWTGGGTVESGDSNVRGMRVYDCIAHQGRLWAIVTHDTDDTQVTIARSTDGATWEETGTSAQASFPGSTAGTHRRNKADTDVWDDVGRLLSFGDTLLIAVWDESNGGIDVHYSTDPEAASPTFTAGAVLDDSGGNGGPKAFVRWKDPFTSPPADSPVLVTANGVFRVDAGGSTYDQIYALDGNGDSGRWAVVGQDGDLYVGLSSGELIALHISATGTIEHRTVGPPGDGFVSARQGYVTYMIAPPRPWLIVAYGGQAAGKTASIFAIEYTQLVDPVTGKVFQPWHHLYGETDANIQITALGYSTEDDGTERLHFAIENTSSDELYHLELPFTDPTSGVTQKFQTSSTMEFPEDDMGDSHNDSTLHEARMEADNLSATNSNEYVEYKYGTDGGNWDATDLGDFLSGDLDLVYGSGAGVAAKTLRNQLVGHRDAGDNTDTVLLKDFEVSVTTTQQLLRQVTLTVDLNESAKEGADAINMTPESVLANLETVITSGTKTAFLIGNLSTMYVRVRQPSPWDLEPLEMGGGDGESTGELHGTATIVLEEVLEGSPVA